VAQFCIEKKLQKFLNLGLDDLLAKFNGFFVDPIKIRSVFLCEDANRQVSR